MGINCGEFGLKFILGRLKAFPKREFVDMMGGGSEYRNSMPIPNKDKNIMCESQDLTLKTPSSGVETTSCNILFPKFLKWCILQSQLHDVDRLQSHTNK